MDFLMDPMFSVYFISCKNNLITLYRAHKIFEEEFCITFSVDLFLIANIL